MEKKSVKHPCISCVYYKACGSTNRTEQCDGRVTKWQLKHIQTMDIHKPIHSTEKYIREEK